MEMRQALKEQYHGGLAMLAECVEYCPDDMWEEGEFPRSFWRIAWHAGFFTHLYLMQNVDVFNDSIPNWPRVIATALGVSETQNEIQIEPFDVPKDVTPLTSREILDYISYVRGLVDGTVDELDLETDESGFSWYPNISKLSHQFMNLRHLQGHVGQLSELLLHRGIETSWIAKSEDPKAG